MPKSTTRSGRVYSRGTHQIRAPYSRRAPRGLAIQAGTDDEDVTSAVLDTEDALADTDTGSHNAGLHNARSDAPINGVMSDIAASDPVDAAHLEQLQEHHDLHIADLDAFANEVLSGLDAPEQVETTQPEQEQEQEDEVHQPQPDIHTNYVDPAQDGGSLDQEGILGEDTPEGSEAAEWVAGGEVLVQARARVALWEEEQRLRGAEQSSVPGNRTVEDGN